MTAKIIDKTFQPLYGQPCWGLDYSRLLNLTMSFGKPSLKVREPIETSTAPSAARRVVTVRGEWWLWLYVCYWRLTLDNRELAKGTSSIKKIEQALAQLGGQKLVSVVIHPETGATQFVFDLGCVLHCRRQNPDSELWTLYKPSGYVLAVHGNGTFTHQRGNVTENLRRPILG